MILYFVCKEIRWVFQHLLFLYTCHMLSIPQFLYDLSIDITSFHFSTHFSFVYIFSRGFKQIIDIHIANCVNSKRLLFMVFRHLKTRHLLFMESIVLSWKFLRPITLVRAPMFLVKCMFKLFDTHYKWIHFCYVTFMQTKYIVLMTYYIWVQNPKIQIIYDVLIHMSVYVYV